jgi:poly(A) polymerase
MDEEQTSCSPPDKRPVVLTRDAHPISRKNIDPDALKILYHLNRLGFTAYLCGGAVRDLMLGKAPKDFDIATDARPGQIKKRFANVYVIGRRFRLAHVHFQGGKIIEVATFRRDPQPGEIENGNEGLDPARLYGSPAEDAFRRDITINALYYDPVSFSVIDYVGGLEDMTLRRVRIIGDPNGRYTEDPVRIWRVLRHAARLGFSVEEATEKAIHTHGPLLASSPGARLYEELNKDLNYETKPVIESLRGYRLLRHVLGAVGEAYEADYGLFSRLLALLDLEERARREGFLLTQDETYALVFWPWAEPLCDRVEGDPGPVITDALMKAGIQATIPRAVRTDAVQILGILRAMLEALRSGYMRWSLRKRAHFSQASRLCFLITEGRAPKEGESFESLFSRAFPDSPTDSKKRRRRRPRRRPGNGGPAPL